MEALKELLPWILFLLVAGGAALLRRWMEKQRKAEQERQKTAAATKPPPAKPRREEEVFEVFEVAKEAPPQTVRPERRVVRPVVVRAKPAAPRPVAGAPQPPRRERIEIAETRVGKKLKTTVKQPSLPLEAKQVGTLRKEEAKRPVAVAQNALTRLLDRENIPRAIVISEILGPPKGLQGRS